MHFTVEEENLICMYHNADRRRTIGRITAALPDMDEGIQTLAQQTLSKLEHMTDADYDNQKFNFTDALLGCVTGCVLGLPLNKMMFQFLIADKWGINWSVPVRSLLLIILLCLASAAISIRRPIKHISEMAIVDTIKFQQ